METFGKVRHNNFFKIIYLGMCFMVLFTARTAAQNIMTQVYIQLGYNSLSQLCFFSMFFCCIGSSVVSSFFYKKVSIKTALFGSVLTIPVFMSAGVLITYCDKYKHSSGICSTPFIYGYNIFTASLQGFGVTFLWIAQPNYVNLCANESTRGIANGIFIALLKASQIYSSIIIALVLGSSDQFFFYIILFGISIVATIMFAFVPAPPSKERGSVDNSREVLVVERGSLSESVKMFCDTILNKNNHFLFSFMVFSGVALTFCGNSLGTYVGLIINSNDVNLINQRTGIIFMVLALGTIVAGPIIGHLADKYDKTSLLSFTAIMLEIGLALTILACFMSSFTLALLCGVVWGLGDTSISTMISVVIGSQFTNRDQILSCYRFFQSAGCLSTTLLSIFLLKENPYLFIMITAGLLLLLQIVISRLRSDEVKKSEEWLLADEGKILVEMKKMSFESFK